MELLSPAGNRDALVAAVSCGAALPDRRRHDRLREGVNVYCLPSNDCPPGEGIAAIPIP